MTITQAQIDDLQNAIKAGTAQALVDKWRNELFLKEAQKAGKVTFTLKAYRGDETREVIGAKVGEGFALHKDAWGGSFWVLTHVKSGIKTLSGKKLQLSAVVKDFAQWKGLDALDAAMTDHGMEALKHMPEHLITEYRALYTEASK